MAKNGHSEFFLTIFPKKTGINLEWPKMAIPKFSNNFSQKDWYKFRMAKNVHSKFIETFLVQKDWKKFGMAIKGHSEFFLTIFPKKTGINSKWPKMDVLNFF